MLDPHKDTIFAPASGPAPGAVGVIRLSGPATNAALFALTGRRHWPARKAILTDLCWPETNKLDRGLVIWFPPLRSYTGEAMAELHIHGGRAVTAIVCAALGDQPGLRLAEAGEFTRRAFDHGKMDLTEAEAVADLVAAETESQRRQATHQLTGEFGRRCDSWRQHLLAVIAACEAALDFSDQDLPKDFLTGQTATLDRLCRDMEALLADDGEGERLRTGYTVVLAGPPNAGKSTLLNALAARDAAIVGDQPGTTRDIVEVGINLSGLPLLLTDTAGLRGDALAGGTSRGHGRGGAPEGQDAGLLDPVEREGIRRARARIDTADLTLLLVAPDTQCETAFDGMAVPRQVLVVVTKSDSLDKDTDQHVQTLAKRARRAAGLSDATPALSVSAVTGQGLESLRQFLRDHFRTRSEAVLSAPPGVTRHRHRVAVTAAAAAVRRALEQNVIELRAEDMRQAAHHLGRITGRVDVEDILGEIFTRFCIGK